MNLKLYSTSSPAISADKSLNLIADITGESREEIDALNCRYTLTVGHLIGVKASNYLLSGDTGKYYFITGYTIENQHVIVTCREDVLSTYISKLRAQTMTVSRNQNISNAYMVDNGYNMLAYRNVVTKEFPSGFDKANDTIILMTVG